MEDQTLFDYRFEFKMLYCCIEKCASCLCPLDEVPPANCVMVDPYLNLSDKSCSFSKNDQLVPAVRHAACITPGQEREKATGF